VTATLLVEPERFGETEIFVEGEAFRHLFRARRLAAGERLRVVDGQGRARWGEVARVERARAFIRLAEPAPPNEPKLRVELLVATLRPERASWLVEKATEVGVATVRFLHTERAPRTFGPGTLERLRRVAAAAVEQCGRARVPEVTGIHGWTEVPALAADVSQRLFLDTEQDREGGTCTAGELGTVLFTGPEGGFTRGEREELLAGGWTPVGLGPRVLRTETAALVGAAAVLGAVDSGRPTG